MMFLLHFFLNNMNKQTQFQRVIHFLVQNGFDPFAAVTGVPKKC